MKLKTTRLDYHSFFEKWTYPLQGTNATDI